MGQACKDNGGESDSFRSAMGNCYATREPRGRLVFPGLKILCKLACVTGSADVFDTLSKSDDDITFCCSEINVKEDGIRRQNGEEAGRQRGVSSLSV